jgi:hypothetical protein
LPENRKILDFTSFRSGRQHLLCCRMSTKLPAVQNQQKSSSSSINKAAGRVQ